MGQTHRITNLQLSSRSAPPPREEVVISSGNSSEDEPLALAFNVA